MPNHRLLTAGIVGFAAALACLGCSAATRAGELYFPDSNASWQHVEPAEVGYDAEGLGRVVDYARAQKSSALVVLHAGRILLEAHWPPGESVGDISPRYRRMVVGTTSDGHVVEDVASVQKSIVSFLTGVAVGRGKLDIHKPVTEYLGAGWSRAEAEAERAITVKHLLSMTSGLDDALRYQAQAGTKWRYNTGAYSKVAAVLEAVLQEPLDVITKQYLTEPIGMRDTRLRPRRWAANIDAAAKIGLATTARDLARFGLLIQAGGNWNGQDLLGAPEYLDVALAPSQDLNRSYGLLWWLNVDAGRPRKASANRMIGRSVTAAPTDMVAAQGALGRKVFVAPSLNLVVVRLGDAPEADFNQQLWTRLRAASKAD